MDGGDVSLEKLLDRWRRGTEPDLLRPAEQTLTGYGADSGAAGGRRVPGQGGDVSALDALRANEQIVSLLTGWRWRAIRQAREQGASWVDVGAALGMSKQGAWDLYHRAVQAQETYAGEFFTSTDRAPSMAVLSAEDDAPTTGVGEK